MDRYNNIKTINNKYYPNLIYPNITKEINDIYIIANGYDRLDILAKKYYDDTSLYWIIAKCNNIFGTLFLTPGTQICIPNSNRLSTIINNFNDINNVNRS
ncbi:MAG TPA: hypothetical protein PLY35_10335 [Thermotogota bacterium]|nr:hypothetical protein [Thermotogota bacterium]